MKLDLHLTIDGATAMAWVSTGGCAGVAGYISHIADLPKTAMLPVIMTTIIPSVISWVAAKRTAR